MVVIRERSHVEIIFNTHRLLEIWEQTISAIGAVHLNLVYCANILCGGENTFEIDGKCWIHPWISIFYTGWTWHHLFCEERHEVEHSVHLAWAWLSRFDLVIPGPFDCLSVTVRCWIRKVIFQNNITKTFLNTLHDKNANCTRCHKRNTTII